MKKTCLKVEYFPNKGTVVPPTGFAAHGPWHCQTVITAKTFFGKSQYLRGKRSHSFQICRVSLFAVLKKCLFFVWTGSDKGLPSLYSCNQYFYENWVLFCLSFQIKNKKH